MSSVNEPIRFGDVIKLYTKSAFIESTAPSSVGFLELAGKTQTQLLVVPPVKEDVKERFTEAEFIIAPIRGDKQQANGTPLTYQTPFVLRTSDGKDGSTYSLNNKVPGQREGVSLQVSATKGEMYIQAEKEGCTKTNDLHYGDDGLSLNVVDSNRVRKTLNHVLTHIVKPKSDSPGGIVNCGAKGTALTFSFQRAIDVDGKPQIETRKYIKDPQARRASIDALSPSKLDQLGRADRVDSSEFSDVDAMSRSSSIAGFGSNPASPRAGSMSSMATHVTAAAVVERLPIVKDVEGPETDAAGLTNTSDESANSSETKPGGSPSKPAKSPKKTAPLKTASEKKDKTKNKAEIIADGKTEPALGSEAVKVEPTKTENTTTEAVKAEPTKTVAVKTEVMKAGTATPEAVKTLPAKTVNTAPATTGAKAALGEPKTVLADASTFPPMPSINGPAPAPVVVSPKSTASPKTDMKGPATPTAAPASPKMMKEEEVAQLKAQAEVDNLEPACAATKCSVM
ncbi:hypothetical protein PHMEG_0004304 [Phytophthora megakarya]|uniref:Uncharacterized protein n=1 Tax=Phytophthora megakarya TaxID=4795 RepID=A0A225WVT5_9STRA|nr:hypothetical protein PHMEG_0004304 [Phytophthora megakarya]